MVGMEKPVIDSKDLLSLNKLNASGTLITNKEKQNEEITSCDDKNKNDNTLEQLKSLLIAQSNMMASVSEKTDLALGELDKTGIAIANVSNNIINVKSDLSTEIANVNNEIASVKTDTDLIKVDVATFKHDLMKVKADVAKIDNKIDIVDQRCNREIRKVKGDFKLVNQKVESREVHIAELKENFQGLHSEIGTQIAAASSKLRNLPENGNYEQLNNNLVDVC